MDMKELQKIKTNYNNAKNGEDSAKYYKQFLQGVCECINEGAWLNFPANQDGKGVGTVIINHHNRLYIAAYATQEKSISTTLFMSQQTISFDILFSCVAYAAI